MGPTKLQVFLLRPIQSRQHVVGIAPQGQGKTLLHVASLVHEYMQNREMYNTLPRQRTVRKKNVEFKPTLCRPRRILFFSR